jgi:hypothetical protein
LNDNNDIFADPFLKKSNEIKSLPEDLLLACAYNLNIIADIIEEAAFFRRTETSDELWITAGYIFSIVQDIVDGTATPKNFEIKKLLGAGRVFALPKKGEPFFACLNLLDRLFRVRTGFYWPQKFLTGGIINKYAFDGLVGRIEHDLEENSQKARETESEIINVARELGLSPNPTGKSPTQWFAGCPNKNHVLFIEARENLFFCGLCSRKGGIKELRAFVRERKEG